MNENTRVNRRDCLKAGAAACVAAGLANSPLATAAQDGPAKLPVTIRDAMLRDVGKADCWSALREIEADGVEASVNIDMSLPAMFHPTTKYSLGSSDGIAAFKQNLAANKMSVLTFIMANQFDSRPDEEIAWMKKLVAACKELNARAVRIDLIPHKVRREEFLPFAIKIGKEISAIAADGGVKLGVENHGNTTNDPEFLQKLFDGVGSPSLGLTLDTANLYWFGHPLDDLYKIYQRFAARVVHTHCKSIAYPEAQRNVRREMGWKYGEYARAIYEGDIDFARVVRILREAGYSGDLCVEDEGLGHYPKAQHGEVLKKEIAFLRKLA